MRWWILLGACILGTVAHFLYEPLGKPRALVMFLPVNESPWEHIKLTFWPLILAMVLICGLEGLPWAAGAEAAAAACAHGACVMFGIHYFYRFALDCDQPVLWVDIATYYAAMISSFRVGLEVLARRPTVLEGLACCVILVSTVYFLDSASFAPPRTHLFRDGRE